MKRLLVLGLLGLSTLVFAADKKHGGSFLDFEARPGAARFGLVQAQALADAQRSAQYGVCGTSVFKEKKGPVWIFETKVGYAGISAPDIAVIEPPSSLPSFGEAKDRANQSPEPTSLLVTIRADARLAPSSAVAHL